MNALESMVKKLKGAGIYTLRGDSVVDYELQAYAAGLNLAIDALSQLENESFLPTATGYGISYWESQFQVEAQGSTEERRAALLKRGAITPNNFTKTDMERVLTMAGLNAEICENTAAKRLYVNCLNETTDDAARRSALKTAKLFLPAHLNAELDFRSISWNNIDKLDESFDKKDSLGYTWDAIDCYGNAMLQI
jgi:hypothetical protein